MCLIQRQWTHAGPAGEIGGGRQTAATGYNTLTRYSRFVAGRTSVCDAVLALAVTSLPRSAQSVAPNSLLKYPCFENPPSKSLGFLHGYLPKKSISTGC
jgi:hypothetical protein